MLPSVSRRAACTRWVAECAWRAARRLTASTTDGRRLADADFTRRHLDRVADEPRHGLLDVEHLELEAGADDHALVGDLAAGLGIQSGLGEDDLGDLALRSRGRRTRPSSRMPSTLDSVSRSV